MKRGESVYVADAVIVVGCCWGWSFCWLLVVACCWLMLFLVVVVSLCWLLVVVFRWF